MCFLSRCLACCLIRYLGRYFVASCATSNTTSNVTPHVHRLIALRVCRLFASRIVFLHVPRYFTYCFVCCLLTLLPFLHCLIALFAPSLAYCLVNLKYLVNLAPPAKLLFHNVVLHCIVGLLPIGWKLVILRPFSFVTRSQELG